MLDWGEAVEFSWTRLDRTIRVRLPFVAGVALVSIVLAGVITTPTRRNPGYAPEQPVAFSHRLHAGDMRVDCRYCHTGVETGRHAGIPSTTVCMNCHSVASVADSTKIQPLLAAATAGVPIRWKRIHRLPEFTYFSHDVHVVKGIDCRTCHGLIEQMDVVRQVMPLSMKFCLDCHREPHEKVAGLAPGTLVGPESCGTCHR